MHKPTTLSKQIQAVRTAARALHQHTTGQLTDGFVLLAPTRLTAYAGGQTVNGLCQVATNTKGGNCVAGCGGGGA